MELQQIKSISDCEVLEELHRLRWPATNGKPRCPRCHELKCRSCKKDFTYKTMTPFTFSSSSDRQILILILSARDGLKYTEASSLSGVKRDTARKWITIVNSEFESSIDGELLFPIPSYKYEYRKKDAVKIKPKRLRKITKRQVAGYILEKKCVIMSHFKEEYKNYDLAGHEQIINTLLNKNRNQLKLIMQGKDPFDRADEINNIQQKIYDEEKKQFDAIGNFDCGNDDPDEWM